MTTIDPAYVTTLADQVWNEIMDDIAEGVIPQNVGTYSALHDHVDANGYLLHLFDDIADPDERDAVWNAVTDAVDNRLAERLAAMPLITDGDIPDDAVRVADEEGALYYRDHDDPTEWNLHTDNGQILTLTADEMRGTYPLHVVARRRTFELEIHHLGGSESTGITLPATSILDALVKADKPIEGDWQVNIYDPADGQTRELRVRATSVETAISAAVEMARGNPLVLVARHAVSFDQPPVVGERVSGTTASGGTWAGVYDGIVPSEHDDEPMHRFHDGHINDVPQTVFAFPAISSPIVDGELAWVKPTAVMSGEVVMVEKRITADLAQVLRADGERVAVPIADMMPITDDVVNALNRAEGV